MAIEDSSSSVRSDLTIDQHHPLYLHPSDASNSLSIGMPLVGMENYTLWREAMKLSLLTLNKLGIVGGSVTRDTYGKTHEHLWDRCNAIIKSWIMNNVSRDLLSGVLFRSNASTIWEDLCERFNKVTTSRMFHLHKSIVTLQQGTSSVSVFYSKLKDLWDEYDSLMPPPVVNVQNPRISLHTYNINACFISYWDSTMVIVMHAAKSL
ncbi:hypothetical protein KY290_038383 [Solanum tuberosum]|uniref:Retrotransposon Copia-like N-terminal domain-containing protein n=1 Tax=Solanum tuberosum TaxID=4113 RepID=A0ABQ7TYV9_SOLTU|nr:hypothetical protein KY290_038383 [Solanum tuberosum]